MAAGLEKYCRSVPQGERGVSTSVAVWINGGGEEGSADGRFIIILYIHMRIIFHLIGENTDMLIHHRSFIR